jgi:hypothetical protein
MQFITIMNRSLDALSTGSLFGIYCEHCFYDHVFYFHSIRSSGRLCRSSYIAHVATNSEKQNILLDVIN